MTSDEIRILFVDDEPLDILFEQSALTRSGISFALRIAASEAEMADASANFNSNDVLCDYAIPGFSGPHGLSADIAAALCDSGLSAERLELDITACSLASHVEASLRCLAQSKRLGVRIALHNFGTGPANFSHLARLPIDRTARGWDGGVAPTPQPRTLQ